MFMVTRDWVHSHKTPRGSWNKPQIESLGMQWCDVTEGWIDRIDGSLISCEQAADFERFKIKPKKNKAKLNNDIRKRLIAKFSQRISKLNPKQLAILENEFDSCSGSNSPVSYK